MSLLVCIPFHGGDKAQAIRLASWLLELGGCSTHDCLLVFDSGTTTDGVIEPLREAFNNVTELRVVGAPKADWSAGTGDARAVNEMWIQTATWMDAKLKRRWFWNEVDCIPLCSRWLDDIEAADTAGGKAFTGARVNPSGGGERMSGIAVYPASVCKYSVRAMMSDRNPWDLVGAEDFKRSVHYTPLIHHFLRSSNESPTFPDLNSLSVIPPNAAVFHPNKDGSLIDRLRERKNGSTESILAAETGRVSTQEYVERLQSGFVPAIVENKPSVLLPESIFEKTDTWASRGIDKPASPPSFSVSDYVCALKALCTSPLAKARVVKALSAAGFVVGDPKPRKHRKKRRA